MKKVIIIVFLIGVSFLSGQKKQNLPQIYSGVQRCKICHETTAIGDHYTVWANSKHSKAYETLLTEESAKIAKLRGISKPANEATECLTCHVTGYNNPKAQFGKKFNKEDGVQCESCHGPGESYRKENIMCDKDLSLENGLILPKPDHCLACHNEKSPKFKPFDYKKYYEIIKHKTNPDFKCSSSEEEEEEW